MNREKYFSMLVLFGLVAFISFSSCSKYEENTGISLRSKQKRVEGNWELTKYEVDGIDSLALREFPVLEFVFYNRHEGDGVSALGTNAGGNWYFDNDDEQIFINFSPPTGISSDSPFRYLTDSDIGVSRHWKILRLKEKEIFLENDAGRNELFNIRIEMTKI